MATINDAGLIVPATGDTLQMSYYLKAKDYGRYDRFPPLADDAKVTWPQLVAHHITDSLIDQDDYDIDMVARGKIYAAMKYHSQSYFGLNGQASQIIPVNRAATGAGGSALFRGKKHEVNNLAFHVEWVSMVLNSKGEKWRKNEKTGKLERIYHTDPRRSDLVADSNGLLWLKVPDAQRQAVGDALIALQAKLKLNPVNLFHGHYSLARGTHIDPGPQVIDALRLIAIERFGLPEDIIIPAGDFQLLPFQIADNPPRDF